MAVAGDALAGGGLHKRRRDATADVQRARAERGEAAARRGGHRACPPGRRERLRLLPPAGIGGRDSREQGPRIGVQGIGEQAFGRARFHDLAEVQDGDVVADVLDHPEIVGDEQVAEAEIVLQPAQEVEDLCLYRDVEGGDGLVAAEEFRAAGERAGDGDALALAAGKTGAGRAGPDPGAGPRPP